MSLRALIMVPAEGDAARQFLWSARAVKDKVFQAQATIVKVSVNLPMDFDDCRQFDAFPIQFATEAGHSFALHPHHTLESFVVISHAGPADGPIFEDRFGHQYQPWSHMAAIIVDEHSGQCNVLKKTDSHLLPEPRAPMPRLRADAFLPRARKFWRLVGECLSTRGKIILLGCNYAAETYIDKVAAASGRATFGPLEKIWAADVATAVAFVRHIERRHADKDARLATPLSAIGRIIARSEISEGERWDFANRVP